MERLTLWKGEIKNDQKKIKDALSLKWRFFRESKGRKGILILRLLLS